MSELWLFLHLSAVAVWIGGMFFAHVCLRPALSVLEAPQRLNLMSEVLSRFFMVVWVAVLVLWASGLAVISGVGFAAAPLGWHLMMGLAAVMTVVFISIALQWHPRLRAAVRSQQWPAAAQALGGIRRRVLLNLVLGALTIAVATLGRWWS